MVKVVFVGQGYTGEQVNAATEVKGIKVDVINLQAVKRGFVLLSRGGIVERSFTWIDRFRRLVSDYERLPETLAGMRFLSFAILMLLQFVHLVAETA